MMQRNLLRSTCASAMALCLFGCDGSVRQSGPDTTGAFILGALTKKSQQANAGLVTVDSDKVLVSFVYSAAVPESFETILEQTPPLISISSLEFLSCSSWNEPQKTSDSHCSEKGTNVLVFVADGIGDFKAVASAISSAWPEAKPNAEVAVNVTDQAASAGAQLGKAPPTCVYVRQPDSTGKISSGAVVVLKLEDVDARVCLLSSLYRIAGIEPYPQGDPVRTVDYLSAHNFGENPLTALRFLYESTHPGRNLIKLERDIDQWVSSQRVP